MSRRETQHKRATYPAYKPSGMNWVVDIPEHWEIHRLKHIASVQFSSVDKHTLEGEEPVRLCNYVDVYYNDFIAAGIEFMSASATQSEIARFQLCRGDVLVTKDSESWDDIAVPSYVAEKLDGVLCGYHLAHIRPHPRKLLGEYLFRAFGSRGINDQFRVAANGITRFGLGKYWLDNGLFPVPPLTEQRAIAAFLDRETARVDALIEKKRRQIELLQEKRSALISYAVTKGLYGMMNDECGMINGGNDGHTHHSSLRTPHFKDSGIEWLGEIPAHWEIKSIRRIAKAVKTGGTPSGAEEMHFDENGFDWYTPSDFHDDLFLIGSSRKLSETGRTEVRIFPAMTVMMIGIGATIGKVALSRKPSSCNQQINAIVCNSKMTPEFLTYVLRVVRGYICRCGKFTTLPIINQEDTKALTITCPPLAEQHDIVSFLNHETDRTEALIGKIQISIEKLREYRTALISAAVTGKIDVRKEVV